MDSANGNTLGAQTMQAQAANQMGAFVTATGQMAVTAQSMQNATELVDASAKPLTVRFLDKVYSLRGSFSAQIAEFRSIVQTKLAEAA
jgi:hypothetical protein